MNELDYATLEASKRLLDAEIVLETEVYWYLGQSGEWKLIYVPPTITARLTPFQIMQPVIEAKEAIPAPCFAEVWRELPETDELMDLVREYAMATLEGWQVINIQRYVFNLFRDVNRMIDLLIWITEQKRKDKP